MQPLTTKDLWPLQHYDDVRDEFRKAVIARKQHRRVAAGPYMTFVFEDRLTVKFQVQEVLRVERIDSKEAIEEELEGFNTMLPGPGELSATLLIELDGSDAEVKAQLARLSGLGEHVWLEIAGRRVRGNFDPGRDDGRRVSAVQYVRFPVGGRIDPARPVALVIDHPNYSHRTELGPEATKSIAADLEG
jgi:hypothetical protein